MLAAESLNQKNYLPKESHEENFDKGKNSGKLVLFSKNEFTHFLDEVNKQFTETGAVDFEKATNNARYLNRLDEAFANIEAGHWTEHELIEDDEDE